MFFYSLIIMFFFFIFQKYLEMEDVVEGEKKLMQDKFESLEFVVRMLELKVKNFVDYGNVFILVILIEYNLNSKMERLVIKF